MADATTPRGATPVKRARNSDEIHTDEEGCDTDGGTPVLRRILGGIQGAIAPQNLLQRQADAALHAKNKLFNDPVHGHIEVDGLCVRIIDTRQFQRLRDIKQLGACYFVFPGGCHNRFEHSIGVSHLAGKMIETLRSKQPELDITNQDVLCVKIAGLCHDLGHGPFSHMFDGYFIPLATGNTDWKHEDASIMMLDHLISENHLMSDFAERGMGKDDIAFIKELIVGKKGANRSEALARRTAGKDFLYEIVANKRNAIDVDKLDYFARDCQYLGMKATYDHSRIIMNARAVKCDGDVYQICHPAKEDWQLYEIFHTRLSLHKRAYQHRVAKIIEYMICDALLLANPYLRFPCADGKTCRLSESIYKPEAYSFITDSVLILIRMSTDPRLDPAKAILRRIDTRDLYRFVGMGLPKRAYDHDDLETIREQIATAVDGVDQRDLVLHIVDFDYGMKDRNPIDFVRFYSKRRMDTADTIKKETVSVIGVPHQFREQQLRVYCKKSDTLSTQRAAQSFRKWARKTGALERDIDYMDVMTPQVSMAASTFAQANAQANATDDEERPGKRRNIAPELDAS